MKSHACRLVLPGAFLLAAGVARAQAPALDCNAQAADPILSVPIPGRPFTTVVTADGCWLFVSTDSSTPRESGGIAVFQRRGNGGVKFKRVVPVPNGVAGMVLTHDGKLLVGAAGEFVVLFDVERLVADDADPIVGYLSDGGNAGSIYVNVTPDDRFLFVSDENDNNITVINLSTARATGFSKDATVGKIPVGGAPVALTFSPDGRFLYTTSEAGLKTWKWPDRCNGEVEDPVLGRVKFAEGAVIAIDVEKATTTPDRAILVRIPAGCSPVRLSLSPNGDSAWVTVRGDNKVMGFDTRKIVTDPKKARIATVAVGKSPVGVTFLRQGRFLLATSSDRFSDQPEAPQSFVVIDTQPAGRASPTVVAKLPAGAFPREFAQSPDGNTLFLTNYRSKTIQVIDVSRLQLTSSPSSR